MLIGEHGSEVRGAGDGVLVLCGGSEHGAQTYGVCAGSMGGVGLVEVGGGNADPSLGTEQFACGTDWKVGLAQVDAVGAGREGDVGAIIDDCGDAGCSGVAERDKARRTPQEFRIVERLFSQLDAVRTAQDACLHYRFPWMVCAQGF